MMAHFYLSCLGHSGLKRAGELSVAKADLLRRKLKGAKGVASVPEYAAFHEFVFETTKPAAQVLESMLKAGILGGMDLGRYDPSRAKQILVCVTEKRTTEEIEKYVEAVGT
jgi:glycine dehydrogenase subunit 1